MDTEGSPPPKRRKQEISQLESAGPSTLTIPQDHGYLEAAQSSESVNSYDRGQQRAEAVHDEAQRSSTPPHVLTRSGPPAPGAKWNVAAKAKIRVSLGKRPASALVTVPEPVLASAGPSWPESRRHKDTLEAVPVHGECVPTDHEDKTASSPSEQIPKPIQETQDGKSPVEDPGCSVDQNGHPPSVIPISISERGRSIQVPDSPLPTAAHLQNVTPTESSAKVVESKFPNTNNSERPQQSSLPQVLVHLTWNSGQGHNLRPFSGSPPSIHASLHTSLRTFVHETAPDGLIDSTDEAPGLLALYRTHEQARAAEVKLGSAEFVWNGQVVDKSVRCYDGNGRRFPAEKKKAGIDGSVPGPSDPSPKDIAKQEGQLESAEGSIYELDSVTGVTSESASDPGLLINFENSQDIFRPDQTAESRFRTGTFETPVVVTSSPVRTNDGDYDRITVFLRSLSQDSCKSVDFDNVIAELLSNLRDLSQDSTSPLRESDTTQSTDIRRAVQSFLRQLELQKLAHPSRRAALHETEIALTLNRINVIQYDKLILSLSTPQELRLTRIDPTIRPGSIAPHEARKNFLDTVFKHYEHHLKMGAEEQGDSMKTESDLILSELRAIQDEFGHVQDLSSPEILQRQSLPTTRPDAAMISPTAEIAGPLISNGQQQSALTTEAGPSTAAKGIPQSSIHGVRNGSDEADAMLTTYSRSDVEAVHKSSKSSAKAVDDDVALSDALPHESIWKRFSGPLARKTIADLPQADQELQIKYMAVASQPDSALPTSKQTRPELLLDRVVKCLACGISGHVDEDSICPASYEDGVGVEKIRLCLETGPCEQDCPRKADDVKSGISSTHCDLCCRARPESRLYIRQWRTYVPRISEIRRVREVPVGCYNCGRSDHYGDDCTKHESGCAPLHRSKGVFSLSNASRYTHKDSKDTAISLPPAKALQYSLKRKSSPAAEEYITIDDSSDDDMSSFLGPKVTREEKQATRIELGQSTAYNGPTLGKHHLSYAAPDNAARRSQAPRSQYPHNGQQTGHGNNARQQGRQGPPGVDNWQPPLPLESPPRGRGGGRGGNRGRAGKNRGGRGRGDSRPGENSYRPLPSAGTNAWKKHRI